MSARRVRPILVTGSHRSGSTWVGRMIASHPRVGYIDEPFNSVNHPECPADHMWHYVTQDDAAQFAAYLRGPLEFRHSWWHEVRERPLPRRLVGATLRSLLALRRRLDGSRPLMKDPIALFSAEWLAATFNMDVVVLIRHPLAFASSIKRLAWRFPFHQLLMQPNLMRTHRLEAYREEMDRLWMQSLDTVEHAILIWRVFHQIILEYRHRHPEWIFLRHEDLSLHPVDEFRKLFARLGLSFPERVRRTIEEHSSEQNESDAPPGTIHKLKRDSKANLSNWKQRLLPEEMARIRAGTEDVARSFYSEESWHAGQQPLPVST